jgi:hypothetical protein
MLGRRVGRDVVASRFQTTFYRRSERRIVVNNMYVPQQRPFFLSQVFITLKLGAMSVAGGKNGHRD